MFSLINVYILLQTSGLNKALPSNVHILTLEPWKDDTILLRLEHLFEVGEAQRMSQPVEVNIQVNFSKNNSSKNKSLICIYIF